MAFDISPIIIATLMRQDMSPSRLLPRGGGSGAGYRITGATPYRGELGMRTSLIGGLLIGLLGGFLLSGQMATSQEEPFPATPEGRGRFQIAGHSTYPPLLLDSETGNSWILMSASDGEERRWVWEPIEMSVPPQSPSQSRGRDVVRLPQLPQHPQRQIVLGKPPSLSW